MAASTINVLLSSFPGLGLPSTLCIPFSADATVSDLHSALSARLPSNLHSRLILTTTSNREISCSSNAALATLLQAPSPTPNNANILPLRLSAPLCGGKGGFGSQLRAAGGRMSSKRKRAQGENNGSSRNLDGRRLRTVTEAKALAEYLSVKPEMERKEKEERRKRWEQVVEASERREEEIRSGNAAGARARVDGKWAEEKEEVEGKTRDAIVAAMRRGALVRVPQKIEVEENAEETDEDSSSDEPGGSSDGLPRESSNREEKVAANTGKGDRKIYGWDDDEDISDSEEE